MRIVPLLRKETLHILRDPRSLYLAVGLPLVMLILFGYAINFDIKHIPIGIIDEDNTSVSRAFISHLHSSEYFDIRLLSRNYSGLERLLDEGKVKILITLPSFFSRDLAKGEDVPIQLLIDGSDSNSALIAMGNLAKFIQTFSSNLVLQVAGRQGSFLLSGTPGIDVQTRSWYNPELRSTNFIVPGLIAVVMMIMTAMLTSLTIAREWETGTMEQLISTPARAPEIVLGKLVPYFVLGLVQTTLVVLTGNLLFKVPLKGNLILLFIASSIFLVGGLGIGLFISTITKSQQLAFMLSILMTLLPSLLLSGFFTPISNMPKIIQIVAYLVPARYFLVILRGIFLKGNGLLVLWPQFLALILFALLILLASAKRMKLSLE
jgi:ABC-2 type transport system permease protein